jgi:hypothetical protein
MFTASLRRKLAFLLLVAFFAAPWATASELRSGDVRAAQAAPKPLDLFGRLWGFLTRVWSETGCNVDPFGRCIPGTTDEQPPTTEGDEGCNVDPLGRCGS